jgi:hypothetical protein
MDLEVVQSDLYKLAYSEPTLFTAAGKLSKICKQLSDR